MQVVVGAAVVRDGRVLACRRTEPPSLAGRWEFPGGKVEPGEAEPAALVRECEEELGLHVVVGARLGGDVAIGGTGVLRVYLASDDGVSVPALRDHDAHRWLRADELYDVVWIEVDLPLVARLAAVLADPSPRGGQAR